MSVDVLVEREGFDSPNATPVNRPRPSEGNDNRPREKGKTDVPTPDARRSR